MIHMFYACCEHTGVFVLCFPFTTMNVSPNPKLEERNIALQSNLSL